MFQKAFPGRTEQFTEKQMLYASPAKSIGKYIFYRILSREMAESFGT